MRDPSAARRPSMDSHSSEQPLAEEGAGHRDRGGRSTAYQPGETSALVTAFTVGGFLVGLAQLILPVVGTVGAATTVSVVATCLGGLCGLVGIRIVRGRRRAHMTKRVWIVILWSLAAASVGALLGFATAYLVQSGDLSQVGWPWSS